MANASRNPLDGVAWNESREGDALAQSTIQISSPHTYLDHSVELAAQQLHRHRCQNQKAAQHYHDDVDNGTERPERFFLPTRTRTSIAGGGKNKSGSDTTGVHGALRAHTHTTSSPIGLMPKMRRWTRITWNTVRYGYPDQLWMTGI